MNHLLTLVSPHTRRWNGNESRKHTAVAVMVSTAGGLGTSIVGVALIGNISLFRKRKWRGRG